MEETDSHQDEPLPDPPEAPEQVEDESWLNRKAIARFIRIILLAAFVAAFIAVLLSIPQLSSTEIAGHTKTTVLVMDLPKPTTVISGSALDSLTLTGDIRARIPGIDAREFQMLRFDARQPDHHLRLDHVKVPALTGVTAVRDRQGEPLRLFYEHPGDPAEPVQLKLSSDARVIARSGDGPSDMETSVKGDSVIHLSPNDEAQMFLEPTASSLMLAPRIEISDLGFHYVRESANRVRQLSGIRSGALYFEAVGGREYQLRPVQRLDIEMTPAGGTLLLTTILRDGIDTHFLASADAITTGTEPNRRSLMPNYLSWLMAQQRFKVAIQIFGAVITAGLGLVTMTFVRGRLA